jgi:hypothetical protein
MRLLELFEIPADMLLIVLLIKFFPYQFVDQIDYHVLNPICRTCTGDKQRSQILACRASQDSPSNFYDNRNLPFLVIPKLGPLDGALA